MARTRPLAYGATAVTLLALALGLASCIPSAPSSTMPSAIASPTATFIPLPTTTFTATPTASPTATPPRSLTPTVTPTDTLAPAPQVTPTDPYALRPRTGEVVAPRLTLDEVQDQGNWRTYGGPDDLLSLLYPAGLELSADTEDCLHAEGCVQLFAHNLGIRVRVLDDVEAGLFELFDEELVRASLMYVLSEAAAPAEFRAASGYLIRGEGQLAYVVEGVYLPAGAGSSPETHAYQLHAFVLEPTGVPVWLTYHRALPDPLLLEEYLGLERMMWSIAVPGNRAAKD